MNLRPMLAGKAPADLDQLRFPLIVSPKLDGIRCLIVDGVAVSRTLKPIRNRCIQNFLGRPEYNGLDGELIVGSPTNPNCMQETTSGVMSFDGEPDFKFYIFDRWDRNQFNIQFSAAYAQLCMLPNLPSELIIHHHEHVFDVPSLEWAEQTVLSDGYEGLILRDPDGPYKFNRSTTREGWMMKLKRFEQDEAVISSVIELEHNFNISETNALGYTERSTTQAGKYLGGKLGALRCSQIYKQPTPVCARQHASYSPALNKFIGPLFNIGTGFTDEERKLLWAQRDFLPGKIVTFKHFAQQGVLNAPRHPVFISFRDKEDL